MGLAAVRGGDAAHYQTSKQQQQHNQQEKEEKQKNNGNGNGNSKMHYDRGLPVE